MVTPAGCYRFNGRTFAKLYKEKGITCKIRWGAKKLNGFPECEQMGRAEEYMRCNIGSDLSV